MAQESEFVNPANTPIGVIVAIVSGLIWMLIYTQIILKFGSNIGAMDYAIGVLVFLLMIGLGFWLGVSGYWMAVSMD